MSVLLAALLAASANPYLAQAKVLHQGLEFEKCLKRLEQASRWESTKAELAEIELYAGLCQFGLGEEREATEHFEMGLKLDPKLALPPLVGPKVSAVFKKAQEKLGPALRDAAEEPAPATAPAPEPPRRVELAPAPPAPPAPTVQEVVQTPPEPHARSRAFVPFAGVSAASAIAASVLGIVALNGQDQANSATFEDDGLRLGAQARTFALATNVLWGVAAAALIATVIVFFAVR